MSQPFSDNMLEIADSMGISMYQRFSLDEAALFLRCPEDELAKLTRQNKISFIQVTSDQIDFFGFQLLEYLLNNVVPRNRQPDDSPTPERVVRSHELQELTGLSRTTIWRLERKGEFPNRVTLAPGSVGWLYSDVMEWMKTR